MMRAGLRERADGQSLPQPWTVEDFLAFEAEEPERYEFVDGIVRMMTGGSAAHSAIKGNIAVRAQDARCDPGPARSTSTTSRS